MAADIKGKVAVVTGGATGMGRAAALEFGRLGAKVAVVTGSNVAGGQETVRLIEAEGGEAAFFQCNVTKEAEVAAMIAAVVEKWGRIDCAFNNVGVGPDGVRIPYGPLTELSEEIWDKVMNVNLKGLFFCAQSAARVLVRQRHGVIVNMSSESGLEGSEGQSVYAASKNAVNSLTRSWAKELGKKGVRVVGVAPGILEATGLRTLSYETALAYTRGITVEQLRAGYAKTSTTPMGRSGKLSEVASVVAFMLSGRAGYVDGVTLNIAGGKTRG